MAGGGQPAAKSKEAGRQAARSSQAAGRPHNKGCHSKVVVAARLAEARTPSKPEVQPARQQTTSKVVAGSRQAQSKGCRSKVVAARLTAARAPSKPAVQSARQ